MLIHLIILRKVVKQTLIAVFVGVVAAGILTAASSSMRLFEPWGRIKKCHNLR